MDMNRHEGNSCDILQVEGINSKGFGLAPKLVMLDDRLSIFSKAIYCYFSCYAGAGKIAFPRVTKIMEDLKIGRTTYYAHFNPLKELGYIKVEQTRKDGRQAHNVYTLMEVIPKLAGHENKPFPPCAVWQDAVLQDAVSQDTVSQDVVTQDAVSQDAVWQDAVLQDAVWQDTVSQDAVSQDAVKQAINNNSLFKNNRSISNIFEKHPPTPQAGGAVAGGEIGSELNTEETANPKLSAKESTQPSENLKLKTGRGEDAQSSSQSMTLADRNFELFWEAYPRKVGKAAALKAWRSLNPDAALYTRIIASIAVSKTSEQWQRENGRYVPNPLTWLNQERWDDIYPVPAPQDNRQPRQSGNALKRILAQIEADEAASANEILVDEYDG